MGHFSRLTYGLHHHLHEFLVNMGKAIKQNGEAEQSYWKRKVTLSSLVCSPYWLTGTTAKHTLTAGDGRLERQSREDA